MSRSISAVQCVMSLVIFVIVSPNVHSQSGITEKQRAAYGGTFAASTEGSNQGGSEGLSGTERNIAGRSLTVLSEQQRKDYGEVYKAALDMQEHRTAIPADSRKIPDYVKQSRQALFRQGLAAASDEPSGVVYLLMWNHIALDATALDHTTISETFGEQFGPTRTSRALAIVHLAMFESVNVISRKHPSYRGVQASVLDKLGLTPAQVTPESASIERAIVEAAYQTLKELYPHKSASLFQTAYDADRQRLGDDPMNRPGNMILGEAVGFEVAKSILKIREFDGAELPDLSSDDFTSTNPKIWKQDPISKLGPALGGNWPRVKPFLIASGDAFRPGSVNLPVLPPAFDSPEFAAAYKEVKDLGGDPNARISADRWPTLTSRTGAADPNDPNPADNTNQTFVGIFWGYDGTALLCAPPRLYNMIATSVALREKPITNVEDMSQYLALINVSLADAGIAAWDAKFHFLIPRPVSYIRTVDVDKTPEGTHNPRWTPLGAPVTNGTDAGRNLTPPFPTYPSGHATFGGSLFQAMTLYFKKLDPMFPDDGVPFEFISDEYNGMNRGPGESVNRKLVVAKFNSFKQAEELNARSRVYLGIHWQFDADHGVMQGNKVAADVFNKFVSPGP